jgi:hypothetical protein
MTIQAVMLPLFVEVLLTFFLLIWMGYQRQVAYRTGATHPRDIALREPNWPKPALQAANSFSNQFELPVLFYVAIILAWITRKADLFFVILAWIFVLARIGQAYVHNTTNQVILRGKIYGVGALALFIMWLMLIVRVLLAV